MFIACELTMLGWKGSGREISDSREAEARIDRVGDALRAAVIGQAERHRHVFCGSLLVGDANTLVGEEVEQLVLFDRTAERGAKLVAILRNGIGMPAAL